jgi:hypothetical protein
MSKVKSPHKGYDLKTDGIWVFLNFKKVGFYKSKEEANSHIQRLIIESPVSLIEYAETLVIR